MEAHTHAIFHIEFLPKQVFFYILRKKEKEFFSKKKKKKVFQWANNFSDNPYQIHKNLDLKKKKAHVTL